MSKKIFSKIALLSSFILVGCGPTNVEDNSLAIMFTNDIHCQIKDGNISFSTLKEFKTTLSKLYKHVSLVDSGDAVEGSVYGTLSKGELIVDAMNEVGYDYCAIGNHEFNYGVDQLHSLINRSNATYLNANVTYDGSKENWIEDLAKYKVVEYGNTKVGYIGITTPFTPQSVAPTIFMEGDKTVYHFDLGGTEQFYSKIQTYIDEMKTQGANYVIALAHMGYSDTEDYSPYSSYNLIEKTTGLDAVLDGHSHTKIESRVVKDKSGKDVLLNQTGTGLNNFGILTIDNNQKMKTFLVGDAKASGDSKIDELCQTYEDLLDTVLCKNNTTLPLLMDGGIRIPRFKESTLGNFASDAMRYKTNSDIAFLNGGGLRDSLEAGDVTIRDILAVNPFNNDIVTSELTGQQIWDMVEYLTRDLEKAENPSLPHLSGLKCDVYVNRTLDAEVDKDSGQLVKINASNDKRRTQNLKVLNKTSNEYETISLDKKYTISSYDYILSNGGEGLLLFLKNNKPIQKEISRDYITLMEYITHLDGDLSIYQNVEGRLKVKND